MLRNKYLNLKNKSYKSLININEKYMPRIFFLSLFDISEICIQVNNVRYNKILQTNS